MLQEPHSHHHREKSVKCNLLAAKVRGQLRILWWTSCCIESRFSRTLPSGYMDRRPLQKQQSCGLRTLDNMYWRSEVLGKFTTIMCSLVEPLRTTNNLFFPISKLASAERRSLNKMSLSKIYYLYLDSPVWGVLQQIKCHIVSRFPNCTTSRERNSVIKFFSTRRGTLVDMELWSYRRLYYWPE